MLFSLPISISKILFFVLSFDQMAWIVFVQATNLGLSKLMHNVHALYTHPKRTLISSSAPSSFAFNFLIISPLGTGSF